MQRKTIKINEQIVHFRIMGSGPTLVLLHASPSSSGMFLPMMEKLAEKYLVIAPDTPGYGTSQPLTAELRTIKDYAFFLKAFLEKIGVGKSAIYGTATGAQIGIRYALEFPNLVEHLYLDNTAHFSKVQREEILEEYFPNLKPQADGQHLKTLWKIVRGIFTYFPWFKNEEAYRVSETLPPTVVLHMVAKDFLIAGKNYATAYRAAFEHEEASHVQALKIPTTLFDWQGSIIKRYIDQLLDFSLPKNIRVVPTSADRTQRIKKMQSIIFDNLSVIDTIKNNDVGGEVWKAPAGKKYSGFPKLIIDDQGEYLLDAWRYLSLKMGDKDLVAVQAELRDWLLSV